MNVIDIIIGIVGLITGYGLTMLSFKTGEKHRQKKGKKNA